jgi:hypothetical protein
MINCKEIQINADKNRESVPPGVPLNVPLGYKYKSLSLIH